MPLHRIISLSLPERAATATMAELRAMPVMRSLAMGCEASAEAHQQIRRWRGQERWQQARARRDGKVRNGGGKVETATAATSVILAAGFSGVAS